eukprot:g23408.t1
MKNILSLVLLMIIASGFGLQFSPLPQCLSLGGRSLVVGMEVSAGASVLDWNETFEGTLGNALRMQGCSGVRLVALQAVQNVDFAFVSPGQLRRLERESSSGDAKVLATVRRVVNGKAVQNTAGVLVRRSGNLAALNEWTDLMNGNQSNLTLCAQANSSFASYQAQEVEMMLKTGSRLEDAFTMHFHGHSDEVILQQMAQGTAQCQVAAVNSHALQNLFATGNYSLADWTVIGAQADSFTEAHSTRVYPEWGVVSVRLLPLELLLLVQSILLTMDYTSFAAQTARHAGFNLPGDYAGASLVQYHLNVFGDGQCAPGMQRQAAGLHICEHCPHGTYSRQGVGECRECVPNSFNNNTGAQSCQVCPEGLIALGYGSTQCIPQQTYVFEPIHECQLFPNGTLKLGALVPSVDVASYTRAVAVSFEYLNQIFHRYQCHVAYEVLNYDQMADALQNEKIDFAFLDAGLFSIYQKKKGLQAIATIIRKSQGLATSRVGGAVVRLSHLHLDLNCIADIANSSVQLTACAVDTRAMDGWVSQWYEWAKLGMDANSFFQSVIFTGSHEATLMALLDGYCDLALVGSGQVEPFAYYANLPQVLFFVFPAPDTHDNYVATLSTDLYPEWPVARMPHVPEIIWRSLGMGLFSIDPNDDAARAGDYISFGHPLDYHEVSMVNYDVGNMGPKLCPPGYARAGIAGSSVELCQPCSAGTYSNVAQTSCAECLPGFFSEPASSSCSKCPDGSTSLKFGSSACVPEGTFVFQPLEECVGAGPIMIGALVATAVPGELSQAKALWPTIQFLNRFFRRYQCSVDVRLYDHAGLLNATEKQEIDAAYLPAGDFAILRERHNISGVSTLIRYLLGSAVSVTGGVIVRLNQGRNKNITSLQEVAAAARTRKLVACPVDQVSLTGWASQWDAFAQVGIDARTVFDQLVWSGSDAASLDMLLSGECDFAFVEAGKLEKYVAGTFMEQDAFFVLNEKRLADFPAALSTDLFPERSLASLPHLSPRIAGLLSVALYSIQPHDYAAQVGSYAGFDAVRADDFASAIQLFYELNLIAPESGACSGGWVRNYSDPLQRCVPCPAGYFSRYGLLPCEPCPAGSITATAGQRVCQACPYGGWTMPGDGTACFAYKQQVKMEVAAIAFSFTLVTLAMLGMFFLVDPSVYSPLEVAGPNYLITYNKCSVSKVFVPLVFCCYALLLTMQTWLAWRVRKLPTIFNESMLIAWLLYNTVFISGLGLLIDFMLDPTQVTALMTTRVTALLLGAMTPVCALFLPKLREIWLERANDSKYSSDKDKENTTSSQTQVQEVKTTKYFSSGGGTQNNSSIIKTSPAGSPRETYASVIVRGSADNTSYKPQRQVFPSSHHSAESSQHESNLSEVDRLISRSKIEFVCDSNLSNQEFVCTEEMMEEVRPYFAKHNEDPQRASEPTRESIPVPRAYGPRATSQTISLNHMMPTQPASRRTASAPGDPVAKEGLSPGDSAECRSSPRNAITFQVHRSPRNMPPTRKNLPPEQADLEDLPILGSEIPPEERKTAAACAMHSSSSTPAESWSSATSSARSSATLSAPTSPIISPVVSPSPSVVNLLNTGVRDSLNTELRDSQPALPGVSGFLELQMQRLSGQQKLDAQVLEDLDDQDDDDDATQQVV